MIDDDQIQGAFDWLRDNATAATQARADRIYLEEFLPAMRAKLASEFIEGGESNAAADTKAKASRAYHDQLTGYRVAVQRDEWYRWHRTRYEALVAAWQTMSANARAIGKVQ